MAKSGEKAMAFVDDLRAKTQAAFDREKDELLAFRRPEALVNALIIVHWPLDGVWYVLGSVWVSGVLGGGGEHGRIISVFWYSS